MFANGRLETFFDSRPLEPDEMGHPSMIERIAARLADFHNVPIKEPKELALFPNLKCWMAKVEGIHFQDASKQKLFKEKFDLEALKRDIKELEQTIGQHHAPIVFSHNDLLAGAPAMCVCFVGI